MTKDHGPSIKDNAKYERLLEQGMSKSKAAAIANAQEIDYNSTPYEERTKEELYEQAKELGIEGRSKMNKSELIHALRNN